MKIASLAEVKAKLSAYVDEAGQNGPVIITRNGRPAAVLVAPEDDEDLEARVMGRSRKLLEILERSRQSLRGGRGLKSKDFWRAVKKREPSKAEAA
ncbi:MAG: type II toxin-antitoxin system Phd/YefM family antitoxin [Deltaproteobacteria bacterium]|nr:type II toxin-antitoxin system Phd/YefM family antitoxin [Deltaproteobacteria bacterium]